MRTLFGKTVKKFEFYKMNYWTDSNNPLKRRKGTFGYIWLENNIRIRIQKGKFYFLNTDGKLGGVILKTTKPYKQIKRMIAIWFKTYRRKNILFEDVSYMRSRCIDGMHNVNLFKNSKISFKENKSKFLILAS